VGAFHTRPILLEETEGTGVDVTISTWYDLGGGWDTLSGSGPDTYTACELRSHAVYVHRHVRYCVHANRCTTRLRTRHVHMLCTYTGMYAIAYMHIGGQHINVHGMFTCCVRTPACTLMRACTSVHNASTYTACSHAVYVHRHVRYRVHAHRWTKRQRTRHVHMLCTYTGMSAICVHAHR
jgi:hypothetical protein